MEIDWSRYLIQLGLVIVTYYTLMTFSPLPRLSRERQFLVFGGIVFVLLFVSELVLPRSV